MDVNDYSQRYDSLRSRFRDNQNDLKSSYDKNLQDQKNVFEQKIQKQKENFNRQNQELKDQNTINADRYNDLTKSTIEDQQKSFLEEVKDLAKTHAKDREGDLLKSSEKFGQLRNAYDKTTQDNEQIHKEAQKNLNQRFEKTIHKDRERSEKEVQNMAMRNEEGNKKLILDNRKDRDQLVQQQEKDLNSLRSSANSDRSMLIGKLKEDAENQKVSFDTDLKNLKLQHNSRVKDIIGSKNIENKNVQDNFLKLQDQLVKKNANEEMLSRNEHLKERKDLESRFNEEIRNIQRLSEQKVRANDNGGFNNKMRDEKLSAMEKRATDLNLELKNQSEHFSKKEGEIDLEFRGRLKDLKQSQQNKLEENDIAANKYLNETISRIKSKNDEKITEVKSEANKNALQKDLQMQSEQRDFKKTVDKDRVQFGNVINEINDKNIKTLSEIKEEISKDKTKYIEQSKKDYNLEKMAIKEDYAKKLELKEQVYEKKLEDLKREMEKVIDNYEYKIVQVDKKSQNEIENLKGIILDQSEKEKSARVEDLKAKNFEHRLEMKNIREHYEKMIYKDRSDSEKLVNKIVQRYEEQLTKERNESQKVLSQKLLEAHTNLERFYKISEIEKSTMRKQYEDRIEQMKS